MKRGDYKSPWTEKFANLNGLTSVSLDRMDYNSIDKAEVLKIDLRLYIYVSEVYSLYMTSQSRVIR